MPKSKTLKNFEIKDKHGSVKVTKAGKPIISKRGNDTSAVKDKGFSKNFKKLDKALYNLEKILSNGSRR